MEAKISQSKRQAFPERELLAALEQWWEKEVDDDPFADPAKKGTLYDLLPTVDSLTLVNMLLTLESLLGFSLPISVIKRGGYRTKEEMTKHLLPRIRRAFEAKHI